MANTYADYVGSDGLGTSGNEFPITFDYIKTSHVAVEINQGPAGGVNVWERKELGPTADYTVVTSPEKRVVLNSTPNSLWRIRVLRDSDASIGIVDFANGSVLTETELDNAYNHNRYLAEEAEEGASGGGFTKNPDGQYDADGLRIENLAAPNSDDDAANKQYVDNTDSARKTYVDNAIATEQSARVAGDNDQVSKTGDTMSGALTLPSSDPTNNDHAARKGYVDSQIAAAVLTGTPSGQIDTANIADGAVTNAKLESGAVTSDKISTTDTNFNVQSDGSIGIGTDTPSSQLHVEGTTQKLYAQIGDSDNNSFSSPEVVLALHGDSLASQVGPGLGFYAGVSCAQLFGVRASGGAGGDFFIKTLTYDAVSETSSMVEYFRINEFGKVGINTDNPTSTLHVNGSLSKSSGSFKIKHPLKPETHELVHSFVEAPQADNIYRGKVNLQNGTAKVNIDTSVGMTEGTFAALNREIQVFTSNESDWDAVKGNVEGNILTINCQNPASTATVSWLVIGERQDDHMYDTEWTDENGKVIVEPLAT
jgi:hypothetical protein